MSQLARQACLGRSQGGCSQGEERVGVRLDPPPRQGLWLGGDLWALLAGPQIPEPRLDRPLDHC